jgi:hypothetical protein
VYSIGIWHEFFACGPPQTLCRKTLSTSCPLCENCSAPVAVNFYLHRNTHLNPLVVNYNANGLNIISLKHCLVHLYWFPSSCRPQAVFRPFIIFAQYSLFLPVRHSHYFINQRNICFLC